MHIIILVYTYTYTHTHTHTHTYWYISLYHVRVLAAKRHVELLRVL